MATNPDLPEAILLEIFSRLPAKSVGRCRCLSKSWRRDLSTAHFVNKHLITRHQQNLALTNSVTDHLHIVTSPLKNDEQVKIWTGLPRKWCVMLGACNGLVLAVPYDQSHTISVMNPITLQQVNAPYPDPAWNYVSTIMDFAGIHLSSRDCASVYGFGYDCYSDDFKVIALQFNYPVESPYGGYVPKSVTLVDLYSVKRHVWKRLDSNIYPYGDLIPSLSRPTNGAFVNGSLHWFIRNRKSGLYCHIAAFDLAREVFHDIPIPPKFDRNPEPPEFSALDNFSGVAIHVIGGCLSIVRNIVGPDSRNSIIGGGTDVWMMKEYGVAESWVRFHIAGHHYGKSLVPLYMVGLGDEQLMCYTEREALIVCDLKDGTTKKVILGVEDTWYSGGIAFVDSLVSPGKCECDNDSG